LEKRPRTEAMRGVGGAGTYSDGKLHFTPVLSHEKILDIIPLAKYSKVLNDIDQQFTDFGATGPYTPGNLGEAQALVKECAQNGIKLYIRRCKHVGSDFLPAVVGNIVKKLESAGVKIITETQIDTILEKSGKIIGLKSKDSVFTAKNFLIAPGRIGANWLKFQAKNIGISYTFQEIEVGVRVEFPSTIMESHSNILHENIYSIITPTYGDVIRTFCPCPHGHVAVEKYDEFVCVNGYSNNSHDSPNSNFNFTTPIILTDPVEDTSEYAVFVAKLANQLGSGKPLLQRLGDLRTGHRSTWDKINSNSVVPTLKDVVPGDISLALPHRIVTNILEGIDILNRVLTGINHESTLLYAPEIKLRGNRLKVNKLLQTEIKNLFVAGDGAGTSGNIVGAAASGIFAARGILSTIQESSLVRSKLMSRHQP